LVEIIIPVGVCAFFWFLFWVVSFPVKIKIENDLSQNITPQQPNLQHVQGSPMPMGYEP
jgi:hypothetical protein